MRVYCPTTGLYRIHKRSRKRIYPPHSHKWKYREPDGKICCPICFATKEIRREWDGLIIVRFYTKRGYHYTTKKGERYAQHETPLIQLPPPVPIGLERWRNRASAKSQDQVNSSQGEGECPPCNAPLKDTEKG